MNNNNSTVKLITILDYIGILFILGFFVEKDNEDVKFHTNQGHYPLHLRHRGQHCRLHSGRFPLDSVCGLGVQPDCHPAVAAGGGYGHPGHRPRRQGRADAPAGYRQALHLYQIRSQNPAVRRDFVNLQAVITKRIKERRMPFFQTGFVPFPPKTGISQAKPAQFPGFWKGMSH